MNRRAFLNQSTAALALATVGPVAPPIAAAAAKLVSVDSKGTPDMNQPTARRPERLTRDNAVLLLVDHQIGLYTGVRDIDTLSLKHNIVGLTRAMLALKVPLIVTTTTEKMWGPLIPELAEALRGI